MSSDSALAPPAARTAGCLELFLVFSALALQGFGGVLPFAYRALVERRQWVTAAEFAELLAFAQILPGPTICNVSLMIGWRYAGVAGALSALAGMLAGPFLIVIALGAAYTRYGDIPQVRAAVGGMAAVAAGLIAATAWKMGAALLRKQAAKGSMAVQALLLLLAFVGLGLLHWRLVAVFLVLAPLGALYFYRNGGRP
ncbi:chromate transporter [Oxalobacteraceae bacterium OM1]|nr:chromate transporter [Oxalobacteraceae bacterium OM1]